MSTRIERLLQRQERELARLEGEEVERMLVALEDGRRELRERLAGLGGRGLDDSWTAQHTRVALLETEQGVRQLEDRLDRVLTEQERGRHEAALKHLLEVIKLKEPSFRDTGGALRSRAIQRLAQEQGLLLHRHSVRRYGSDLVGRIQRELVLGQTSQMTLDQVVDRIVGTDKSVFSNMRYRAELIARMEAARMYDDGHQASLEEAAAILDDPDEPDPLMKRADEFTDSRNHPFSRALHGRLAPVKGEWVIPVAEVRMHAEALGRGISGILWREENGAYRGGRYPAHFNDRGRQVAWRKSWEQTESFYQMEKRIGRQREEHAVAVMSDGSRLETGPEYTRLTGGNPANACHFPAHFSDSIRRDPNPVVTHNHPSSSPFSPEDLRTAARLDVKEIRAVSRSGGVWRATRPTKGWPDARILEKAAESAFEEAVEAARHRMVSIIEAAGGNPFQGRKALGYSEDTWKRILDEEATSAFELRLGHFGVRARYETDPD